ncbi:hypothetical protein [Prosthecobacter sp.]|uniref:hypothetical protein n=1 Tax=Prosthecobacter sp. TaxID=1965333 RepID=UPI003785097B
MAFQFDSESQQKIPEQAPPRERIGKFSLLVMGGFGMLLLGLFAWHPVTRAARAALGRKNAKEANEATEAKDWTRAYQALVLARQRAPEDEQVLLAWVAFLKASGADAGGLAQTLQTLKKQRPLTEDEELLLGRSLIASGKTKDARAVYEKLPAQQSTRQAGLTLLSDILSAEGHAKEAAEAARRAAAQDTARPETKLQMVTQDLTSPMAEVRKDAYEQLWKLAEGTDESSLEAVSRLAAHPFLTLPQARRLLELEEKHPLKSLKDRLQVVSALMRLQPEQRTELAEAEVRRFASTKRGTREEMAFWLMRENLNDQVFALVPRDLALQSRELYPILVQAMAQAKRWEELKELLKIPRPPVPAILLDLAMVEVLSHLQPDMRESRHLLEGTVVNAAQAGDLNTLNAAATLAEKLNFADIACQAYKEAGLQAAKTGQSEPALQNLQKSAELALRAKDTGTLLEAVRRLHELSPSSVVFADRFVYLRLVLGVEMETVDVGSLTPQNELNAALHVKVERIPAPLLRALSAYRLGDREEMQKQLAALPRAETLPPGPRAVVAGLLTLAGKPDRGFQMAEKISGTVLLDEEMVFLKRAL